MTRLYNPLIPGFHPDPSVMEAGGACYLVNTLHADLVTLPPGEITLRIETAPPPAGFGAEATRPALSWRWNVVRPARWPFRAGRE